MAVLWFVPHRLRVNTCELKDLRIHIQCKNPEPGIAKIFVNVDVGQITPALPR